MKNLGRIKAGDTLTSRESEVLLMVGKGLTNSEAASALKLSPATINDHLKAIFLKLDVSNRVEAAVWACKAGML